MTDLPRELAAIAQRMQSMPRSELNTAVKAWSRVVGERKRSSSQRLFAATCEAAGRAVLSGLDPAPVLAGAAGALGYETPSTSTAEAPKPKPRRARRRSPGGRWNEAD